MPETDKPSNRDHYDYGWRAGLCREANGMLLSGEFPLLQECWLPAGHSRRQAHRNHEDSKRADTQWRQPTLDGLELRQANIMRDAVANILAAGDPSPKWFLGRAAAIRGGAQHG